MKALKWIWVGLLVFAVIFVGRAVESTFDVKLSLGSYIVVAFVVLLVVFLAILSEDRRP